MAVHFDGLVNLQELDLSGNLIEQEHLASDIFAKNTNMRWLDLSDNSLRGLPAGIFGKNTQLTHLFLNDNNLRPTLPADIFKNNDSLYTLDIRNTNIIDLWFISTQASLRNLYLDSIFDSYSLHLLRSVATGIAILVDGVITSEDDLLPASSFPMLFRTPQVQKAITKKVGWPDVRVIKESHLKSIKTSLQASFDLRNKSITTLQSHDFEFMSEINFLDLRDNALTSLPAGLFDTNVNLMTVSLSGNRLETIPEGLFDKMPLLIALTLASNNLSSLPMNIFEKNKNLAIVNLAGNNFSEDFKRRFREKYGDRISGLQF